MAKSAHKSAIVTGASQGLGRALALELAAQGVPLALVARRPGPLKEVVDEIRRKGGRAVAIAADVSRKEDIHSIVGQAALAHGPVDLLVNNASTLGPTPLRLLLDTECEDLEQVLQTNLVGPFRLTKLVLGNMALRGAGTVVNISSDASIQAYPRWGVYSVTKAALDHLTRVWAEELRDWPGVRLIAIDPGEMDTRMHADAMPEADPSTLARPEAVARKIADRILAVDRPSGAREAV
jgi:NAD(P)-dependent dehydrogenase (short-subunit alcohol dehydrogenase family)